MPRAGPRTCWPSRSSARCARSSIVATELGASGPARNIAPLRVVTYQALGGDWFFALPLLLVPDISAVGYLGGLRLGASTYNLAHNWRPPSLRLDSGRGCPAT